MTCQRFQDFIGYIHDESFKYNNNRHESIVKLTKNHLVKVLSNYVHAKHVKISDQLTSHNWYSVLSPHVSLAITIVKLLARYGFTTRRVSKTCIYIACDSWWSRSRRTWSLLVILRSIAVPSNDSFAPTINPRKHGIGAINQVPTCIGWYLSLSFSSMVYINPCFFPEWAAEKMAPITPFTE